MGCMQSTPASEPVAAPPASTKPVASAPASNVSAAAAGAAEPEVEAAPGSAQDKKYTVNGVSITEVGVVFYHVEAVDGSVTIKRRFNDFKALYAALGQVSGLPPLPESGLRTTLRGKHSQELLKEREAAFVKILNAIANTTALAESAPFQKFLTTAA